MLPQADEAGDGAGVLVGQPLHQDLLVGATCSDLHPLQLQELLEDPTFNLVPLKEKCVYKNFILFNVN